MSKKFNELDMDWEIIEKTGSSKIPEDELWCNKQGIYLGKKFEGWIDKQLVIAISSNKEYVKIRVASPKEKGFSFGRHGKVLTSKLITRYFPQGTKLKIIDKSPNHVVAKKI